MRRVLSIKNLVLKRACLVLFAGLLIYMVLFGALILPNDDEHSLSILSIERIDNSKKGAKQSKKQSHNHTFDRNKFHHFYDKIEYSKFPRQHIYNKSHVLKIKITIPSTCNEKEYLFRETERNSWIQYMNTSNLLWNETHSRCHVSYNYLIGNCYDEEIKKESLLHNDIKQINVEEKWELLQKKTIEVLLYEFAQKEFEFDVLLKTDTDSYVNVPKLCDFMIELMEQTKWNPRQDGFYLGRFRDQVRIRLEKEDKYEDIAWHNKIRNANYLPYMAGFGYLLSYKAVEIAANALVNTKDYVSFSKMEDCYLGHFLTSYDVKFMNLQSVIGEWCKLDESGLDQFILDHSYKKHRCNGTMIEKYNLHAKIQKGQPKLDKLIFIQIYTTNNITLRNRRCIESIFYHYPLATVYIFSNVLSNNNDNILLFTELGFDIQIINYSLKTLLLEIKDNKLITEELINTFIDNKLPIISKGRYWYSHETDLIRLLILYKYGGIYLDTDVIIIDNNINNIKIGHDEFNNVLGYEYPPKGRPKYLNGAIMKFKKNHYYMELCIHEFLRNYRENPWAYNGPMLLTRVALNNISQYNLCDYKEDTMDNINEKHRKSKCHVNLLPEIAFHYFYYNDVAKECFEKTKNETTKGIIYNNTYAIHLNNKMTYMYEKTKRGTLCHDIFNDFCLFCDDMV